MLQPGESFADRYTIVVLIGRGAFGSVYEAVDGNLDARVALKVLSSDALTTPQAVSQFLVEAKVFGRVGSEHIVRVLDVGVDKPSGRAYLAMELLVGATLDATVSEKGPLTPGLVATCMRHAAIAIDKAHQYRDAKGELRPIVHRDLKPENLFLTHREDGAPCLKILDFGIAKLVGGVTSVTSAGKGTPLFMAYEQAAGESITPATDIWALGLIAFYLLTGVSYWRSAANPEAKLPALLAEVLTLPLVPPSERLRELGVRVELPADFDDWFFQCVHRDPKLRFRAAGAAAAALSYMLGGLPSGALAQTVPMLHGAPFTGGDTLVDAAVAPAESAPSTGVRTTQGAVATKNQPAERSRTLWFAGAAVSTALIVWFAVNAMGRRSTSTVVASNEPAATAPVRSSTEMEPAVAADEAVGAAKMEVREPSGEEESSPAPSGDEGILASEQPPRSTAKPPAPRSAPVGTAAPTDVVLTAEPEPAAGAAGAPGGSPAPDCDPPWYFDISGVKRFNPACLGQTPALSPYPNPTAMTRELNRATLVARHCPAPFGHGGPVAVRGSVNETGGLSHFRIVTASIIGTETAHCIESAFRSVKIPPYSGANTPFSRVVVVTEPAATK